MWISLKALLTRLKLASIMAFLGEIGWKATAKWFTTEGSPPFGEPEWGDSFFKIKYFTRYRHRSLPLAAVAGVRALAYPPSSRKT
jgi:hypothetical protein